jgi:hypothetical protein
MLHLNTHAATRAMVAHRLAGGTTATLPVIQGGATASTLTLTGAFTALGTAIKGNIFVMFAFLAIIFAIGYAIYKSMINPSLITIILMVAAAFWVWNYATSALATTAAAAGPALIPLAGAILAIGAGIGLAAAGLGYFVSSLNDLGTGLAENMTTTAEAIAGIVDSINDLETDRAMVFAATMVPIAAMGGAGRVSAAGTSAATRGAGGGTAAAAGGGAAMPSDIHVHVDVAGKSFAQAVHSVEVRPTAPGGGSSELYNSIQRNHNKNWSSS